MRKLDYMKKVYELAACYFDTSKEIMAFFMQVNVDLDGETPLVLIANGKGQIVIDLLEDALLGRPN